MKHQQLSIMGLFGKPTTRSSSPSEVEKTRRRIRQNAARWGADSQTASNYAGAVVRQRHGWRVSEGDKKLINDVRTKHCSNRKSS